MFHRRWMRGSLTRVGKIRLTFGDLFTHLEKKQALAGRVRDSALDLNYDERTTLLTKLDCVFERRKLSPVRGVHRV